MARRMNMALRPVHRLKHIIDSAATVAAAASLVVPIVVASDTPDLATTTEVETGAKVNGIYFRIEVASNEAVDLGAIPNVYLAIVKNPGNNLSFTSINALGANDNKRFVIHQEMTMIENKGQGSNARTLFNGVVVIPRGYRRFAPNDTLSVIVLSPQLNIAVCLQAHYKEFR